ncbi:hypothetical protein C8R47DRAFT_181325 [Mycena vitilis]|nr:hypothetical protein C8R47DRAFT_181325 [Mycena vitilis]
MASDSNVPGGELMRKWDEGRMTNGTTAAGFSGVGNAADFNAIGHSAFDGLPPAKRRKFAPRVQFEVGASDVPMELTQKRAFSDSPRERAVPLTIHRAQNDSKEPQPPLTIRIPPRRVARRYNLRAKESKSAAVQFSSKRNAQTNVKKPDRQDARQSRRFACWYDTCKQTFTRHYDATRHAIGAHNGKRHECLGCKRWFSRADALHRHQRSKCGDAK